jgi:hypothetical protein
MRIDEGKLERETTLISRVLLSLVKESRPFKSMPVGEYWVNLLAGTNGYWVFNRDRQDFEERTGRNRQQVQLLHALLPKLKSIVFLISRASKDKSAPYLYGDYMPENARMFLGYLIPIDWTWRDFDQNLNDLVTNIKEAVRHELEHMHQSVAAVKQAALSYNKGMYAYFLDPAETEAFAAGLYKHAKMHKVSVKVMLDQFFDKVAIDYGAQIGKSSGDPVVRLVIKKIRATWEAYIRRRFPSAILENIR